MTLLFWTCAALFAWVYVGYPLWLAVWSRARPAAIGDPDYRPRVSVVIAAHNEARWIHDRIRNVLDSNYPNERLQLIVISDGSSDGTTEIARGIDDPRLLLLEVQPGAGKSNALNLAMPHTTGEVVVFSDANVLFDPDAISRLVSRFADRTCGAVTGRVELVALEAGGEPLGEGVYMRLERFLQDRESRVATAVGADGAMLAVRRELVPHLPAGLVLDDFFIAMHIAGSGHRVCYEATAHGTEHVPASVEQEFRRKVRIAAGCFQILPYLTFLRRPWRQPALWFCFVSHKLLRWTTILYMAGMLIASLTLVAQPFWLMVTAAQIAVYGLALTGWYSPASRRYTAVYVPYYFTVLNIAFAVGFWRQLRRGQSVTWQRVERGEVPRS